MAAGDRRKVEALKKRALLLIEFELTIPVMLAGIIKATSAPGDSGQLPCPICHDGIVRWSRDKTNGHIDLTCTRRYKGEDNKWHRCLAVIE
jgi:hypothetical protein